jgi:hypothetical protein
MAREQLKDLEGAAFDRAKFRAATGHDVSEQDVFNAHLEFRANNIPGVRSDVELLDAVAGHLEDKFGIKRRVTNIDRNRSRGIQDRLKLSAHSHGVDLDDYTTNIATIRDSISTTPGFKFSAHTTGRASRPRPHCRLLLELVAHFEPRRHAPLHRSAFCRLSEAPQIEHLTLPDAPHSSHMNGYMTKLSTGTENTIIRGIAAPTSIEWRPENAAMQAISSANAPIIVMPRASIQLIFIGVQLGA